MSTSAPTPPDSPDLPDVTWPLLLGQFVALAQASISFPPTDEGDRWRLAVPSIIHLQAACMALMHLDRLPRADRPSAIDKAGHLITEHTENLISLWPQALPSALSELVDDAQASLLQSRKHVSRIAGEGGDAVAG